MIYIFEFKTKIVDLAINVSENYVEEIGINNCKTQFYKYKEIKDGRLKQKDGGVGLLGANDYNRLNHLYSLVNLLDNYFSGKIVNFSEIPINFSSYLDFAKKILNALRDVKYGGTLSYKELALKAGFSEKYSRACAAALSINKTPIVIPCHRIIYSNGKLGGYSGGGGARFKNKLLYFEQTIAAN